MKIPCGKLFCFAFCSGPASRHGFPTSFRTHAMAIANSSDLSKTDSKISGTDSGCCGGRSANHGLPETLQGECEVAVMDRSHAVVSTNNALFRV